MEEGEFSDAREDIATLIEDYSEIEADDGVADETKQFN